MDILEYMLPDQVWALSNHLAIANGGQPIYTTVTGNQIWYIKNAQGFPWDMNTFDSKFVYQSITEVDWTNPKTFKMFASKSWPGSNGGVVWSPRAVPDNARGIVTADSSYRAYLDCANFTLHNLGGGILTEVWPDEFDFKGDLGVRDSLTLQYRWGQNSANLEVNRYAKGFGWAQWELWTLQDGQYVQKQVSAFNMFKPGGSVKPVFPCGVPNIV
jgi:hypothetical protein